MPKVRMIAGNYTGGENPVLTSPTPLPADLRVGRMAVQGARYKPTPYMMTCAGRLPVPLKLQDRHSTAYAERLPSQRMI